MKHALIGAVALAGLPAAGAAQVLLYQIDTSGAGDSLGQSVAGLGDVNWDGVGDFAIGSPDDDSFFWIDTGSVRVVSGRDGSTLYTVYGTDPGSRFGWSVAGIGDITGDGAGELVVGAPFRDTTAGVDVGQVSLLSGVDGHEMWTWTGVSAGDLLGWSVCGTGDVDGDGTGDFAWSSLLGDVLINGTPHNDVGVVEVHSGKPNYGSLTFFYGENTLDDFGWSIDGAGDVDGDGLGDVVIGAPKFDALGNDTGKGYVYRGMGGSGSLLYTRIGAWVGGELGASVAGLGDLDGDGYGEVAFGEPLADVNGTDSGRVLVSTGAWPHGALLILKGSAGMHFGASVAGAGDTDADGTPDIAVGAPFADALFSPDAGRVSVHSGYGGVKMMSWYGAGSSTHFGWSVAGLGDLNGDGRTDVLAGGPGWDGNGSDSGLARVYLTDGTFPSVYCTAKTNSQGCAPAIGFSGVPSASVGDNFHVTSTGDLNQKAGMLILAWAAGNTPLWGGTLCLSFPIKRTVMQWSFGSTTGDDCSGTYDFFFSHAYMQSQGFAAGQTLYGQYWSRDPGFAPPNDVDLSNAIQFDILP